MDVPELTFRNVARSAGVLAGLVGAHHFLFLMGAFGPVSCWTSQSSTGSSGETTGSGESTTEVSHGCEAGIDYLFGSTDGNAPVLFFWAMVLIGLVALGGYAAWTGRRGLVWLTVVIGVVISIIGVFSIGWFFVLPTLLLLVAATARSLEARRATAG